MRTTPRSSPSSTDDASVTNVAIGDWCLVAGNRPDAWVLWQNGARRQISDVHRTWPNQVGEPLTAAVHSHHREHEPPPGGRAARTYELFMLSEATDDPDE